MAKTKEYQGLYEEKTQLEGLDELPELTSGQEDLKSKIRNLFKRIRGGGAFKKKMAAILRWLTRRKKENVNAVP